MADLHMSNGIEAPPMPHNVHSKLNVLAEPRAHRLDWRVMWKITFFTALGMALLNFVTVMSMRSIVGLKFWLMQWVTNNYGVGLGTATLVCFSAFTATATTLIISTAPVAGGSGAPENRGWLNGSSDKPLGGWTEWHLVVRGLATILGNASGYPVGREGPTVSMASNFAFLVTKHFAEEEVRHQMALPSSQMPMPSAQAVTITDEERLQHAQRVACAVGGACGMAMIFDAPLGGILYMLEEVTSFCWPLELTFRAFLGTVVCAMLSRILLHLFGKDVKAFVVYEWSPQQHVWEWSDVPGFLIVSIFLGVFSAGHSKICLKVGELRQKAMKGSERFCKYNKQVEAVLYACLCALVSALVAQMGQCEKEEGVSAELVRYNCAEGEYNPVASLLVTTSEAAVNHLFSRKNAGAIHPLNCLLAFCAYTFLNIGLTGVPVPSGNFTGTMLIGGLVGRMMGSVFHTLTGSSASGTYAMVGSAAMLCGFKRMSLAVVVFVAGAANDFNLVPPLMLSVVVSLALSQRCLPRGYDEEQVLRRKVAFLDPEPPSCVDSKNAGDLMRDVKEAHLPPEATRDDLKRALGHRDVIDFPVVREGRCYGFITRDHLEAVVTVWSQAAVANDNTLTRKVSEPLLAMIHQLPEGAKLPVERLVEPVPYTILEDMPAPRMYMLFAKAGITRAGVISPNGELRGIITRRGLIHYIEEEEKKATDGHG